MPEMTDEQKDDAANQMAAYIDQLKEHYDQYIESLVNDGMIASPPSPQEKEKIFRTAKAQHADEPELDDLVIKICPRLITESWKAEIREKKKDERQSRDRWEKGKAFGKYAPEIEIKNTIPERPAGEKNATPKQIKYLKMLGVHDKYVLKSLGNVQASKLIEEILALREKAHVGTGENTESITTRSRSKVAKTQASKSGSGLMIVVFVVILIAFAAWAKLSH